MRESLASPRARWARGPLPTDTNSPESDFPFQFTGRTRPLRNLYYYRARYYDPRAGRFMSARRQVFDVDPVQKIFRSVLISLGKLDQPDEFGVVGAQLPGFFEVGDRSGHVFSL